MKYSTHMYAKALAEVAAAAKPADHPHIEKNFLALVERNSDGSRLRKILDEAARILGRTGGGRTVVFESARLLTAAQKKDVKMFVKPGDTVEERMNPSLVAGVRVIVNDEEQFDGSFKGKMDALFRNI